MKWKFNLDSARFPDSSLFKVSISGAAFAPAGNDSLGSFRLDLWTRLASASVRAISSPKFLDLFQTL